MVVDLNADRTAQNVANQLGSEGLLIAGVAATGAAGGLFVADWVANKVLPMLGLPTSPDSMLDVIGTVSVKGATAAAALLAASELTGIGEAAALFVALGVAASAGIDIIDVFVGFPDLAQMGGSGNLSRSGGSKPTVKRRSSTRTTASGGSSSGGSTSSQGVRSRNQF